MNKKIWSSFSKKVFLGIQGYRWTFMDNDKIQRVLTVTQVLVQLSNPVTEHRQTARLYALIMPGARDQDVLSFLAEWFDPLPQLTKQYLLKYFVETNEAEMVELKTRRLFLKRSPCPAHFSPREFALGSKVILYGRDLVIASYADKPTEVALAPAMETAAFLIGPGAFSSNAGKILDALISATGGVLDKLKTVRLNTEQAKEVSRHLYQTDQSAVRRSGVDSGGTVLFGVVRGGDAGALAAKACTNISTELGGGDVGGGVFCAASGKPTEELEGLFARGGPIARGKGSTTATFDSCTCCVIKPHAVKAGHVGKIVDRIICEGYEVSALEMFELNRTQAHEFLEVYKGVIPDFSEAVDEMVTGSCVALEVRGQNAVQSFRDTAGPWNVDMAKELRPKSIRAMYGETGARTGIHCTDLPEDGASECQFFFELMQGVH